MAATVVQNKLNSVSSHEIQLSPDLSESEGTVTEGILPAGSKSQEPVNVFTGIYVDRISELSFKESYWEVEFYVWFRWNGDSVKPGEHLQVIQGQIVTKVKEAESVQEQTHYEEYRVLARITKHFDESRFPRDDHLLIIQIEDMTNPSFQLRYEADVNGSGLNKQVKVSGYEIYRTGAVVRLHTYDTDFGDPSALPNYEDTYSQFTYGIWLTRPSWGFYLKTFQGLFVAVLASMLALIIRPSRAEPRFTLGVGALFAAVANTYITQSYLPNTGIMTLTDMVNGLGLLTILLTLIQSTISLYLWEKWSKEKSTHLFDGASLIVLFVGYVIINVTLPIVASL
ncbi:hypothetical protein ACFLUL_00725 [Chloroflexota bacterium]